MTKHAVLLAGLLLLGGCVDEQSLVAAQAEYIEALEKGIEIRDAYIQLLETEGPGACGDGREI